MRQYERKPPSPQGRKDSVGNVEAVHGIALEVGEGKIVTLLGANGAGKTTTLRAISGLLRPRAGQIMLRGTDITNLPAHEIVNMGVAHVPEGRRVFATLTVEENLKLGAYKHRREPQRWVGTIKKVYELFPRLEERRNQLAGTLSGGEQQMLAIGRGLMAEPRSSSLTSHPWASPQTGAGDLPGHHRDQPPRHHRAAGGAERPHGPEDIRRRLRPGDRQDRPVRPRRRAPRRSQSQKGLPRRG